MPFQDQLTPGETHTYRIEVAAGDFLHIVVDQQGVDVEASLLDPGGIRRIRMDRPIDVYGPEPLMAIAKEAGGYTVEVVAASGKRPEGRYEIRIEHLRPATTDDRSNALAMEIFSDAKALYRQRKNRRAAERFDAAQKAWAQLGDRSWQAESLVRLGQTRARLRDWGPAIDHFRQAADLFSQEGNARWQAKALQQLGLAHFFLRDLDNAALSFEKALPLRRAAGDRRGEAMTLHALAQTSQVRDEVQQALDSYSQALTLFEWPKDRARTNHNLGVLYLSLGRLERASDALQKAGKFWAETGDRRRQATTFNQLGELHRESGDLDAAFDYYQKALYLRRELEDRRGEVTSVANIGRVYQSRGEADKASASYLEARDLLIGLQRPRLQARVLLNMGSLHLDQEQPALAQAKYRGSLDLYRQVEDPTGEAEALLGVARAGHRLGQLATALEDSEAALSIFESIRPRAVSPELRTSFFATVQGHFDFHIDLLMELHRLEPAAGFDARALVAAERARARSLLDLLAEAGAKVRRDTAPALLERERNLQGQLNARERERFQLRHTPRPQEKDLLAVEKNVEVALQQLEEVRGEIRAQHPRYAALTQPLSLPELQRQVLDHDTLLLEYRLGEKRSFLWALTPHSLDSFELPGRVRIEGIALKAYDLLIDSHRRENRDNTRKALCQLGRLLLKPVADRMTGKRLLVVADGALQFIPFAALVWPGSDDDDCWSARPLVVDHEITYLSSASALAIHRRRLEHRPSPAHLVAIVADPVFSVEDERLASAQSSHATSPPGNQASNTSTRGEGSGPSHYEEANLRSFAPLPFSRQEAEAILSLSEAGSSFSAVGLDANKQLVAQGLLADYRFVHFATHGVLNAKHPELSGIVLSLVDRKGRLQDGFLRAHEIYNLELNCELVVLSACSTALGKVVRGEGLLSLTRGFMYAGAERVMVSLWNVSDQSTAQLMERFYGDLLKQNLRPAAALRAAQISMWNDEERSAPYYWAGFVIEGEWK